MSEEIVFVEEDVFSVIEREEPFFITSGERGPQGPKGDTGDTGGAVPDILFEAGEDIVKGDPLYVSANKFYKASSLGVNPVVGLARDSVLTGFTAAAVIAGELSGLVGVVPNARYFLGETGIVSAPPSSGRLQELGVGLTTTTLLVDLKQDFILI